MFLRLFAVADGSHKLSLLAPITQCQILLSRMDGAHIFCAAIPIVNLESVQEIGIHHDCIHTEGMRVYDQKTGFLNTRADTLQGQRPHITRVSQPILGNAVNQIIIRDVCRPVRGCKIDLTGKQHVQIIGSGLAEKMIPPHEIIHLLLPGTVLHFLERGEVDVIGADDPVIPRFLVAADQCLGRAAGAGADLACVAMQFEFVLGVGVSFLGNWFVSEIIIFLLVGLDVAADPSYLLMSTNWPEEQRFFNSTHRSYIALLT